MKVFQIDWFAFFLVVSFLIVFFLLKLYLRPLVSSKAQFFFSKVSLLKDYPSSKRVVLSKVPFILKVVALTFFLIAFIDPHFLISQKTEDLSKNNEEAGAKEETQENNQDNIELAKIPTEGIAMYLVLDQSGSMNQEVVVKTAGGKKVKVTRIELLKQMTSYFIRGDSKYGLKGRAQDMLGLLSFARVARVISPLTLDHAALLEQLKKLETVKVQKEDGTAIGYAIYKAANLIVATQHFAKNLKEEENPAYTIKNTVMVVVTDGLHNPNPLDKNHDLRTMSLSTASNFAKKENIRLYIINIEPAIAYPDFKQEREELQRAAEKTGGKFYLTKNPSDLIAMYSEIDQLEKSLLPVEEEVEVVVKEKKIEKGKEYFIRESFYQYLIGIGIFFLFFGIFFETTYFRQVP